MKALAMTLTTKNRSMAEVTQVNGKAEQEPRPRAHDDEHEEPEVEEQSKLFV